MCHRTLHLQEADFLVNASGIARQRAACAYHAVAGNDERQRVVSDGPAHGLR